MVLDGSHLSTSAVVVFVSPSSRHTVRALGWLAWAASVAGSLGSGVRRAIHTVGFWVYIPLYQYARYSRKTGYQPRNPQQAHFTGLFG